MVDVKPSGLRTLCDSLKLQILTATSSYRVRASPTHASLCMYCKTKQFHSLFNDDALRNYSVTFDIDDIHLPWLSLVATYHWSPFIPLTWPKRLNKAEGSWLQCGLASTHIQNLVCGCFYSPLHLFGYKNIFLGCRFCDICCCTLFLALELNTARSINIAHPPSLHWQSHSTIVSKSSVVSFVVVTVLLNYKFLYLLLLLCSHIFFCRFKL